MKKEFSPTGLSVGDIVIDHHKGKQKVLAISGEIFAVSWANDFSKYGYWISFDEANNHYWTIEQPSTPKRKVTQAEVDEVFGEPTEIV